jgi:two-component system CheB/CheR fusion protein
MPAKKKDARSQEKKEKEKSQKGQAKKKTQAKKKEKVGGKAEAKKQKKSEGGKARKKAKQEKKFEAEAKEKRKGPPKVKPEEKSEKKTAETREEAGKDGFPIVGIGASAGGLQALENFFAKLPAECNMAFVIVQHLDPHHESLMNSLLSKETPLKVDDIKDGVPVKANHIYLKPPGKDVIIENRRLYLRKAKEDGGLRLPIDSFFRSLAEDQKEKAVCIILSGASNDGTLGAKLVKGEGGLVIAQEEGQAQYPRMPKSVIDAGLADIILPVEKMPEQLMQLFDHPFMVPKIPEAAEVKFENAVQGVLMLVRTHTGNDFSQYKKNTVLRRIQRRMALNQIHEIEDYRRYLRQNSKEVTELFKDLTINVTSYFRDHEAFSRLAEVGIKPLLEKREVDTSFRVWVPGCSSGEEAYSLAILLVESADELEKYFDFRVFATDINSDAIEAARSGEFPENIQADITPDRLKRFFTKKGNKYLVDSKIRDLMVFAVHDVTRDPPFSNTELVSCRNLLIYMDNDLQKRVLPMLHYGLKPGGVLFLGTSETIGEASELFEVVDKKNKIYRHKDVEIEPMHHFQLPRYQPPEEEELEMPRERAEETARPRKKEQVQSLVEHAILKKYSPPAILIDEASDILYFHGNTGRYLSPPVGEANWNVFNMVGGGLHFRLSQAVEKVKKSKEAVRIDKAQVRHNDEFLSLALVCTPLSSKKDKNRYILVEFEEQQAEKDAGKDWAEEEEGEKDPDVAELEQKLHVTRQELQATIEELETANEELKSSNEELQANNEELQSTNEELESSKEELQSTNEELETVSTELTKKNQDLMDAEDDLNNLFASSEIGTLFLDNDLNVKRFTPAAKEIFNLQEERDLGRSISDITSNLKYDTLAEDTEEVLDKLTRKEVKVPGPNDSRYVVRIVPCRSRKNVIEGVIITFLDVSHFERSELNARDAKNFFYNTLSAMWEPVLVLDEELKIFTANRSFYRTFEVTSKDTENRFIFELGDGQWDIPDLRKFLEEIIPHDTEFQGFEVAHDFPGIGHRKFSLNARRIEEGEERPAMILVGFKDVTEE